MYSGSNANACRFLTNVTRSRCRVVHFATLFDRRGSLTRLTLGASTFDDFSRFIRLVTATAGLLSFMKFFFILFCRIFCFMCKNSAVYTFLCRVSCQMIEHLIVVCFIRSCFFSTVNRTVKKCHVIEVAKFQPTSAATSYR